MALVVIGIIVIFGLLSGVSKSPTSPKETLRGTSIPITKKGLAPSTTPPTETPRDRAIAINNKGLELIKEGRCNEAIPTFKQAAAVDPSFHEPLNNIAFCLYDQGQVDLAITHWRKALKLKSDSPDTNAGLGMALYTQGNIDEGQRYYQEAMRIDPNYRDPVWLKRERLWSDRAIANSAALRDTNIP
jgi:tetratricopeptide (TPR) repeat protein